MRGGTSRALFFHRGDLPDPGSDHAGWNRIFLAALGSPDPNGRQLDGMGGGISSLSKIAVIAPSSRGDADVDYTFAQVGVDNSVVGYRGNCGNISSAVGPFAVDEGLVKVTGPTARVRIHNTNTSKIIVASFPVVDGKAAVDGDFELEGVAGTSAPIRLDFLDPAGAGTGRLLPTGSVVDRLETATFGPLMASMVDAANPTVFVALDALGLDGSPSAADLAGDPRLMQGFEDIRIAAAQAMGLIETAEEGRTRLRNLPLVALVAAPHDTRLASGDTLAAADADIVVRMISAGQPHKATPLTGAMCVAVAARLEGSVVHKVARPSPASADQRIAHPSGTLTVAAEIAGADGKIEVRSATVYRTARRLMEGRVLVPVSKLQGLSIG
jgi:2-methylaconitate cis-trans-isomerase PrpF